MKQAIKTLICLMVTLPTLAQAGDVFGESRSTTFDGLPGIVVEISGSSARQLMLNLNAERKENPNGVVEVTGQNVACYLVNLQTKCIIRFHNDGSAATWMQ